MPKPSQKKKVFSNKATAKASTRRGRAAQPAKPPPPRSRPPVSAPRTSGLGGSYGSMAMMVDASRATHIPPPIPLGPYTVVRGRSTFQIATNAAGQRTALLVGPHTVTTIGSRDLTVSPIIGVSGVGSNVPGTTDTLYQDAIIAPYAATLANNTANGNLHGLTVVINCLSTATLAENQVFFGSLNQRINRTRFANWNDVADTLINRREVQPHSAYSLLAAPLKVSAFPVDIVDWASQKPLVLSPAPVGENVTLDSLSQLVFVFPPTSAVVNYSITVYTEWRINFVDSALASTASTHKASKMDTWSTLAALGSETAGFVQEAKTMMASGKALHSGIMGATSTMARAALLLGL